MRSGLLAAFTAGAGLLAVNTDPAAPPPQVSAVAERTVPSEHVRLELPARRALTPGGRDLFATPAPPPAPRVEYEAQPPPPPTAPPLPFTFLGTFEAEGGEIAFYLGDAEKLHVVRLGEAVNGYRVESAAADRLELVYLPLAIKQTLVLGNPK